MNDAASKSDFVEQIIAKGAIGADDIRLLKGGIFSDGALDRAEAEIIFRLDRACPTKDPAWNDFYVETLTDYFVWSAEPPRHVGDEAARFLIAQVVQDRRINGETELELLLNVVQWSEDCPDQLNRFVLDAVRDSVLNADSAVYGQGRSPGVIDPIDVEVISRAIFARAGGGGFAVTRREADFLFDLNDATAQADNAESWSDLFVKAIANHLMFPDGAPVVADAKKALRREAWIEERQTVGGLLKHVGRAVGTLKLGQAWDDMDPFGSRAIEERAARVANRARVAEGRGRVAEPEAMWLLGRISANGALHPNEQALLQFIRQKASDVHPALAPLLPKADL